MTGIATAQLMAEYIIHHTQISFKNHNNQGQMTYIGMYRVSQEKAMIDTVWRTSH
jgi:hypothetical protein